MAELAIRSPRELLPRLRGQNIGNSERLVMLLAGAALLGYAWNKRSKKIGLASAGLLARGATGYCPAYRAMGVNHSETRHALSGPKGVHIRESITIDAPAEEIYRFWRELDRLPEVMPHLEHVERLDSRRSRWTARAFDAVPVTWQAEIINDVPFETIAWSTVDGEAIQHAGSVTFKPAFGDRGTEVHVHLQYSAPGGKAASWLAWLAGEDPAQRLREGLRGLKRRLEAGPTRSNDLGPYRSPSPSPLH